MNYRFCSLTHPGRTRSNNEDSVTFDATAQFGVVADGMGGYSAGEIASSMATASITTELARWLSQAGAKADIDDVRRALEICVSNANASIYLASRTNPDYVGMGTTLVAGVFHGNQLLLAHIGDSRCYCLRGKELLQITKDHSLVQQHIDAGLMTALQAAASPLRNLVTRAMGVANEVLLEINTHRVKVGDIYLMCTDGLSDMLDGTAIARILRNGSELTEMADELVSQANKKGGRDNITVLLIQAISAPERPG